MWRLRTVLMWLVLLPAASSYGQDTNGPWGLERSPEGGLSIYDDGRLRIKPTFDMELAGFGQSNAWWGSSREILGDRVGVWGEGMVEPGLTVTGSLGSAGSLEARYSYMGVSTRGGIDATGGNFPDETAESWLPEDLYLKWRSGDLLQGLGKDALELSFGRQDYQLGDGFLFWLGGQSGGTRGGYWLAAREAWRVAAIARLKTGPLRSEVVYLSPADSPNSHTYILGANFDYELGQRATLGFGYFKILASDILLRDGLSVFDGRARWSPFEALPGLTLSGEYVHQQNGGQLRAFGYYGEIGYEIAKRSWKPLVAYRFASFSGDRDSLGPSRAFDPLFYGMPEWGTWYQGEIFGEYVVSNQNLLSHRLRVRVEPHDAVTVNLFYYHFRLNERPTVIAARDQPRLANVTSKHLGDEIDLTVDWAARRWLSVSGVAAVAFPGDAAKQFVGNERNWISLMLLGTVHF